MLRSQKLPIDLAVTEEGAGDSKEVLNSECKSFLSFFPFFFSFSFFSARMTYDDAGRSE